MKTILSLVFLVLSFSTFANLKILDTSEATTQALVDFQEMASENKIQKFNGFKSWPVSGGVKVKIYVKGEDSVEFSCHRHSDSEPFECH